MKLKTVVVMLVLFLTSMAFALEEITIEPYFKLGTLRGNEHNHPEGSGRKFYIGYGADFTPTDRSSAVAEVRRCAEAGSAGPHRH